MNFLGQLLPGFRNVRAPLIGGYLWLVVAWLLFSDDLPRSGESEVYGRAAELGETIGPIALAVAVSVAAYLIGSLVKAAASLLGNWLVALKRRLFQGGWVGALGTIPLTWLGTWPFFRPTDIDWLDGDEKAKDRLKNLVDAELSPSLDALEGAVARATEKVADDGSDVVLALYSETSVETGATVSAFVALGSEGQARHPLSEQLELPAFSADRDIFQEKAAIKTLMMETTRQAGSEVERLYSEAELRLYVALPLLAVLIVLGIKSGDLIWWPLLLAPLGLLAHAIALNKQGGLEMVEGLRSRNSPEDLKKITPVFSRYKVRAVELSEAIDTFDWPALVREANSASTTRAGDGVEWDLIRSRGRNQQVIPPNG